MATLAKDFLHSSVEDSLTLSRSKRLNELQQWTYDFVKRGLMLPSPNGTNTEYAERFVFDVDAPQITVDLIKSGAVDQNLIWETAEMPAPRFWIEFPAGEKGLRVGMMVGHVFKTDSILSSTRLMLALVAGAGSPKATRVIGLITLPSIKLEPGSAALLHWYQEHVAREDIDRREEYTHDALQFIGDLSRSLFLINTPRVAEIKTVTIGSPAKRLRKDPTALPLVELRRVTLKVGVSPTRYVNADGSRPVAGESAEARHRRMHSVIGHFRTLRKDREQPKVSYVPQHYRGDPALGVLLHERVVKK